MEACTEMAFEQGWPAHSAALPNDPVMYLLIPGHGQAGTTLPLNAQELERFIERPDRQ